MRHQNVFHEAHFFSSFLGLVLFISLLISHGCAQKYLDSQIGSDSSNGDVGNPWRTFDHACLQLTISPSPSLFLNGEFSSNQPCELPSSLEKDPSASKAKLLLKSQLAMGSQKFVQGIELVISPPGVFTLATAQPSAIRSSNITSTTSTEPLIIVPVGSTLEIEDCEFHPVFLSLLPIAFQPTIYASNANLHITRSVFSGTSIIGSTGSAIEVKQSSLIISDSTFNGFPDGAIYAHLGSNVEISGSTFRQNSVSSGYLSTRSSGGSAVFGENLVKLTIETSIFDSNAGKTAVYVNSAENVTISDSIFNANVAPTDCAALALVDAFNVTLTGSTFRNNVFGEGKWWTTCVSTSAAATEAHIFDSVWTGNTATNIEEAPLYDMTGYSLLFSNNVRASVGSLSFEGENVYFSSVGSFHGASITVKPSSDGLASEWRGYVAVCGNITFETDMTFDGRMILSRADSCLQLNLVNLGGRQLTIKTPSSLVPGVDAELADNWLQTGNFINGTLNIDSAKTTVCCDIVVPETEVLSDMIRFTDVNISASTTFVWGTSRTKFELIRSVLVLNPNAVLIQSRPKNDTNGDEAVISGHVIVEGGARIEAKGMKIRGILDMRSGSLLHVYPSRWRDMEHPFIVEGKAIINGTLIPSADLLSGSFTPNLVYSGETPLFGSNTAPFEVLRADSLNSVLSDGTRALQFDVSAVPTGAEATPSKISPTVIISYNLDSLIFNWPIPITVEEPSLSDCSFWISSLNTWFNKDESRCTWMSTTQMVLYSGSLPKDGAIFFAAPAVTYALVSPPPQIVEPEAQLSILTTACGDVLLRADASTGFGSFAPIYHFFSGSVAFAPQSSPSFALNSNDFTPGQSYTVELAAQNAFGQISQTSSTTFTMPEYASVYIEGPINRRQPITSNLVLNAKFSLPYDCMSSLATEWQWKGPLLDALPNFSASNSPTLSIAAAALQNGNINIDQEYEIAVKATTELGSSQHTIKIVFFNPLFLQSRSRSRFYGNDQIRLQVEMLSRDTIANITYSWTMLECADEFAESTFKPVVSLNTSIALPKKCRGISSTFDIRQTTSVPNLVVPSDDFLDGRYKVRCTARWQIAVAGLSSFEIPLEFYFYYQRTSGTKVTVVVPKTSILQRGSKIPIRLEVDTGSTTLKGADILQSFSSVHWRVNDAAVDPHLDGKAFLILPYSTVSGIVTISATVSDGANAFKGESVIAVGEAPSGGSLNYSISAGSLTLSTQSWSSHVIGSAQLRYQFFLHFPESGETYPLNDLSDSPSTTTERVSNGNFTAIVRAYDAFDRFSEVRKNISLIVSAKRSSTAIDEEMRTQLQAALNVSDWRLGRAAVLSLLRSSPENADDWILSALNLTSSLPDTDSSGATIMGQLSQMLQIVSENVSTVQTEAILSAVSNVLLSPGSRFGSSSIASETATNYFFQVMNMILTPSTNVAGEKVVSLISRHADQATFDTFPEELVHWSSGALSMVSSRVGTAGQPVRISNPVAGVPVSVAFNPNDFSSSGANGYIAFYQVVYDGNYPIPTPDASFPYVAETKFTPLGANGTDLDTPSLGISKTQNPTGGSNGKYETVFTTTTVLQSSTPLCVTPSGSGWSSACETFSQGGSVTCSCSGPTTLSLAFDLSDPAGSKGGLSAGAAAAIGVTLGVIFIVIVIVLVVLFVPGVKDFVRPFRQRGKAKSSV